MCEIGNSKISSSIGNKFYLLHTRSGFSTIELLIAFSVGITFVSASLMLVFSDSNFNKKLSLETGQMSTIDNLRNNDFSKINSEQLHQLLINLINDWNTTTPSSTNYNFVKISDTSPCLKSISSEVSWKTFGRLQNNSKITATKSRDIASKLGRGNCDPVPASAWLKPESTTQNELNISGSENITDIKINSINGKRYAFIISNPNSGINKNEFSVVDVSNTNLNSSSLKATLPLGSGLLGLTVTPNYIYVLQNDITNHVRIIDIHNPENPLLLPLVISLQKITCTFDVQTCQRKGRSITYYDGYLYIGTGYMAGNSPEFHIICVSDFTIPGCTPTTPVETAQLNINHNINDVMIKDSYAYLAVSADYGELTMVDISNKKSLQLPPDYLNPDVNNLKYNVKATNGSVSDEDAFSIFVLGNFVYLGRQRVTSVNKKDFYILDVRKPDNITLVSSTTLGMTSVNSYISKIIVNNGTGFIATTDTSASLRIIDFSDLKNPKTKNNCGKIHTNFGASSLDFRDNLIFLTNASSTPNLKIFTDNNYVCTP